MTIPIRFGKFEPLKATRQEMAEYAARKYDTRKSADGEPIDYQEIGPLSGQPSVSTFLVATGAQDVATLQEKRTANQTHRETELKPVDSRIRTGVDTAIANLQQSTFAIEGQHRVRLNSTPLGQFFQAIDQLKKQYESMLPQTQSRGVFEIDDNGFSTWVDQMAPRSWDANTHWVSDINRQEAASAT